MRYVGGKGRISRRIADVILSSTAERQHYLEPFVGGGAVFSAVAPYFENSRAGDIHLDLVLMWQAVAKGWRPPSFVCEEEWKELRSAEPSALRGFVGFGCSFGGRWFEGYARGEGRNFADESARNVISSTDAFSRATVECRPYWEWQPREGEVVYCDPPYRASSTTIFRHSFRYFDHEKFWAIAEGWRGQGVAVFVSEYDAPRGWNSVAEWPLNVSVGRTGRSARNIERLWVLW